MVPTNFSHFIFETKECFGPQIYVVQISTVHAPGLLLIIWTLPEGHKQHKSNYEVFSCNEYNRQNVTLSYLAKTK